MLRIFVVIVLIIAVLLLTGYIWRDKFPWLDQAYHQLGLPETPKALEGLRGESRSQVFYRWQDEEGVWHYDTQPPKNGQPYERLRIDSDANLIPGQTP